MISFMSEALRTIITELHENVGEDFRVSGSYDYDLETHGLSPPINSALNWCTYTQKRSLQQLPVPCYSTVDWKEGRQMACMVQLGKESWAVGFVC